MNKDQFTQIYRVSQRSGKADYSPLNVKTDKATVELHYQKIFSIIEAVSLVNTNTNLGFLKETPNIFVDFLMQNFIMLLLS